jgi:hypothetical protein
MGNVIDMGDPVYRDTYQRLAESLGESTSGRYVVLTEDPENEYDVHRFQAFGPFGKVYAIDLAGSMVSDLASNPLTGNVKVRVISWAPEPAVW